MENDKGQKMSLICNMITNDDGYKQISKVFENLEIGSEVKAIGRFTIDTSKLLDRKNPRYQTTMHEQVRCLFNEIEFTK